MELMEQEAEGLGLDGASFCAFSDDALPRVYGYFLHRTGGSPALAEDLTQETFLAAVRELKKGSAPRRPSPGSTASHGTSCSITTGAGNEPSASCPRWRRTPT